MRAAMAGHEEEEPVLLERTARATRGKRYRFPKTGLPYAEKEAFTTIRERFIKEECERKKQKKLIWENYLILYLVMDLNTRGEDQNLEEKDVQILHVGARFRSIPALDVLEDE